MWFNTGFLDKRFLQADKDILWDNKTKANNMLSNLTSLKNTIISVKNQNKNNLLLIEAQKNNAQANYTAALDNLENIKLGGTSLELKAAESRVELARQDINLIEQQIKRAFLTAPSQARVSLIQTREQERITAFSPVLTLIPEQDFQVKADVYEGDIVKIKTGNKTIVEFIAFPNQEFGGEIISVNPIGKLKDNVVYYEIIVGLENVPENLMVEMTADLIIQTEKKENVLIVPQEAVIREGGKTFVKVWQNRQIIEREVKTGISDFSGKVEIIQGLELGETIILD